MFRSMYKLQNEKRKTTNNKNPKTPTACVHRRKGPPEADLFLEEGFTLHSPSAASRVLESGSFFFFSLKAADQRCFHPNEGKTGLTGAGAPG